MLMAGCADLPEQTFPLGGLWNVMREQCRAPSQEQQPLAPGPRDLPPGNRSRAALRFRETGNGTLWSLRPEGFEGRDALARQRRLHFPGFSRSSRGSQGERLKSITFDPVKSRVEAF